METCESFTMISSGIFGFISGFSEFYLEFELIKDMAGRNFHRIRIIFYANFVILSIISI